MADQAAPGWNSDMFNQFRQRVMDRFQCSEKEATARVLTAWDNMMQDLMEQPQQPPPHPQPPATPPSPPRNDDPRPPTRKKIAFPDFDLNAVIPSQVPHGPSQYAIGKIEAMEYVELWYFTTEGCRETRKTTPIAADTYSPPNTDSGLALQPITATKASPNAVDDEHLSWEQIMTARHNIIATASRAGWPDKHVRSLAELYIVLESRGATGSSTRALILYQAVVRRQWHAAMKGRGTPFNVAKINEELLDRLNNQIRDQDLEETRKQASRNFQLNGSNQS